jgi:hypothetical protein
VLEVNISRGPQQPQCDVSHLIVHEGSLPGIVLFCPSELG